MHFGRLKLRFRECLRLTEIDTDLSLEQAQALASPKCQLGYVRRTNGLCENEFVTYAIMNLEHRI
jgi:hypothetical protein